MTTGPMAVRYSGKPTFGTRRITTSTLGTVSTKAEFVAFRTKRDAELGMPKLIIPSLQTNMKAGHLPKAEGNGVAYFKVPIDGL